MISKIEKSIDDIEEYLNSCKFQPLSNTKIIVNKDTMEELINELRKNAPEEIQRYQKMLSNKEAILADAQSKADQIIQQAQIQTTELISEHQIMQQAYIQADEIVKYATQQAQDIIDKATLEANNFRMYAVTYTDDKLKSLQEILENSIDSSKARYENLISSLQGFLDIVSANRTELQPTLSAQSVQEKKTVKPKTDETSDADPDLSVVNISDTQ